MDMQSIATGLFAAFSKNEEKEGCVEYCDVCGKPNREYKRISVPQGAFVFPCAIECDCGKEHARRQEAIVTQKNRLRAYPFSDKANVNAEQTFSCWQGGNDNLKTLSLAYCEAFNQRIVDGVGFVLSGERGVGKSFALSCIANELRDCRWNTVFVNHQTLLTKIKGTFDKGSSDTVGSILGIIENADIVILDEIGVGRSSQFVVDQSYEIIDILYRRKTPLLAATNLSSDGLSEYFKDSSFGIDRITPRIFERSPLQVVTGDNLRLRQSVQAENAISGLLNI